MEVDNEKIKRLFKKNLPEAVNEVKQVKQNKKEEKKIPKAINACMNGKWAKNLSIKGFGFPVGSKEDKKIRRYLCGELTRLV